MSGNIESRIDELLSKDFTKTSTDEILNIISGGADLNIPYEDLQSEEGFSKELEKSQKEVDAVIESLKPKPLPLSIEEIEKLSCNYEGDSLYSVILLESLKREDPKSYEKLVSSKEYKENKTISEIDLGVKLTNNKDLGFSKKIPSDGILKYLRKNNPAFLEKTNEKIFDNLDPLLLGKPSNSGSRKKRDLKILGFQMPLEFIMNKQEIVHVKIGGDDINLDGALEKINGILKKQNKNSNPCSFKDLKEDSPDSDTSGESDSDKSGESTDDITRSVRIEDFDSNFYPDGDDPIIDDDCLQGFPEDPITGDQILTKEGFEDSLDDFCDPPNYNFNEPTDQNPTDQNPNDQNPNDPIPPSVNPDDIDACVASALEKSKELEDDIKKLARWQMIERNLEEILYHYEAIYEYQKSLHDNWLARIPKNSGGDPTNLQIGITILTYRDQIEEYNKELISQKQTYESDKSIFLKNNSIFTKNLFLFNVYQTELSEDELTILFNEKIQANLSPITYNEETKTWPVSDGVIKFKENVENIRSIIIQKNFILITENKIKETQSLLDASVSTLAQKTNTSVSLKDIEKSFIPGNTSATDIYGQGDTSLEKNERVFKSPLSLLISLESYPYDSYGYDFLKALEEFSVRYKTNFNRNLGELQFELSLSTDYGSPLPFKKIKKTSKITFKGGSTDPLSENNEPDEQKIKIGNEHSNNGGLISSYFPEYLNSYQFLKIKNIKTGQSDVAKFYDFIEKIIKTNNSKESIINDIVKDRGILYGNLIEKSASNWLFFNATERGDNDARDPSKTRPSSFTDDGEPTPVFTDFYSNFKTKWNAKYLENKNLYINPALEDLKKKARKAAEGLSKTLPASDAIGIRIVENYLDVKKKYEQIKEIMLFSSQKISSLNDSVSPESVTKRFSDIKCAGADSVPDKNDKENCPPVCCGKAGSDFDTDNYLLSSPPSSDCPTIFQRCWWKQFCKDVTKVGLLPYPNGLPPIESTSFFLGGGPSVRLGLKYWPVGYLPPAFIPIPFPNPIDGNPYIRIPLPMIWTVVPPILIPLPFNLGMIVIFIPFIGGFMPTPLVYVKEFITGSSFFLTGLRGPRFIPRKSDPKINDPLEKIKQAISFGIPDKLIPLPGFGLDNIDSQSRVLSDIKANINKIFDSVPPPGNVQELRDLQEKERNLKRIIQEKERDYKSKSALIDSPNPDISTETEELKNIVPQRKEVIKKLIKEYLTTGIPEPKSIYFPKDKDKLKIDIPGVTKSLRSLREMKSSLAPISCPNYINFKDEIREVLKLIRIVCPPEYSLENAGVANSSNIFLKRNKDPRNMNRDEFSELVNTVRDASLKIAKVILDGNKLSVVKKVRDGAFSVAAPGEFSGVFKFPPIKITNSAPASLKFLKKKNAQIEDIKNRILSGLSNIEYSVDDFSKYVRYSDTGPILVIRVKDLKKIFSKKIGLSKKRPSDPVRPLDVEEPLISRFPYPKGPLSCMDSISNGFGNAVSLFELPTVFPVKQDQITQTPGAGGIIQVTIPGSKIKSFIAESIDKSLDSGKLEEDFPEINDINSPKFINLEPRDIQKISKNLVMDLIDPNSPDLPEFLSILKIPVFPPARPTDMIEQALIGLGAPPPARIVYSLFWKYFKSLPKTPLADSLILPKVSASSKLLSKIPWPLAVLIGRNILNILNPIAMSDDHPVWRRMSLKNTYYVVYIDEFLRSAADVSGLFKFFFGSADPIYPIPELTSELRKAFNQKKY